MPADLKAARPVRTFYAVYAVAILLSGALLYFYARWLLVSAFAIAGGILEISAAYVALRGHQAGGQFPRFVFHLMTAGFLCLVMSNIWQQILQPVPPG